MDRKTIRSNHIGIHLTSKMTIPVNFYIMLPSALFHRNEKVAIKKISPFEHQTYCQVTFLQKDIDRWYLREDKFGPTLKCRGHVIWPIESISSIFTTSPLDYKSFLKAFSWDFFYLPCFCCTILTWYMGTIMACSSVQNEENNTLKAHIKKHRASPIFWF